MPHFFKQLHLTLPLLVAGFLLQNCNEQDQDVQPERQTVQFSLSTASTYSHGVTDIDLPENAHAKISVSSSNGSSILSDHVVAIVKRGGVYITDPLELSAGSYVVTDFMIVEDSLDLYVTPKKGSEFTTSDADALPYQFSLTRNDLATVSLKVVDVRNEDVQRFGYPSSKAKANSLSIAVYDKSFGALSLTGAIAELHQNKKLLKVFSLDAAINTITLDGDPKLPYTILAYTGTSAKRQTFNVKQLKQENGKKPLQILLEPALVLTIESYVDESNDYEDFFNFRMEGNGVVNINWGDGDQSDATLPFETAHEYVAGNYTAIITGDIHQVTDFSGFSYSTIISSITGTTNLTSLKVFDPSWGAVPITVDLSNCKQLERINVAKYGAPYEPVDLRTDFKLPTEHNIHTFIFDAPSFDISRENISADELESMVNNIYTNAIARNINNGKFFVNPVVAPSAETQQKIDILRNEYSWQVGFNDEIYDIYNFEAGRSGGKANPDAAREQWLRERFSKGDKIIARASAAASMK